MFRSNDTVNGNNMAQEKVLISIFILFIYSKKWENKIKTITESIIPFSNSFSLENGMKGRWEEWVQHGMRTLSKSRETLWIVSLFFKGRTTYFVVYITVWFSCTRAILTGSNIFFPGTALYFQRFEKISFRLFIRIWMFGDMMWNLFTFIHLFPTSRNTSDVRSRIHPSQVAQKQTREVSVDPAILNSSH